MQPLNVHKDYEVGVIGKTSTLPKNGDVILTHMSQTKGERNSLVLSRAAF